MAKNSLSVSWICEAVSERFRDRENRNIYILRLVITAVMLIGGTIHALKGSPLDKVFPDRIVDVLQDWTRPLNHWLQDHQNFTNAWLIWTGFLMDVASVLYFLGIVCKERCMRPFFGIIFLFQVRMVFLKTFIMPIPDDEFLFYYPGFYALTFPYGKNNDFFFSGHISSTLFMTLDHYYSGWKKSAAVSLFVCLNQFPLLLATRAHYSVDLLAGFVFGHWVFIVADYLSEQFYKLYDTRKTSSLQTSFVGDELTESSYEKLA